jgi:hypothetical protein
MIAAQCTCGSVSVIGSISSRRGDRPLPTLQIHRQAIAITDFSAAQVQGRTSHDADVHCHRCGWRLAVHASRRGAFCQFLPPQPPMGGLPACPARPVMPVPRPIRRLFRDFDTAADDAQDFELMFAGTRDPIVGSYSGLGRFVVDSEYLTFAD